MPDDDGKNIPWGKFVHPIALAGGIHKLDTGSITRHSARRKIIKRRGFKFSPSPIVQ